MVITQNRTADELFKMIIKLIEQNNMQNYDSEGEKPADVDTSEMELTFTSHPEPEPELLYTNDILAILIFVPIMLIFVAVFVIYYVKYKYFKIR
jgi:hypothetical protein